MTEDKTYGERIQESISKNTTVPITFPVKVYKEFKDWSFENASGCFWLAIEKLLINYKNQVALNDTINELVTRDEYVLSKVIELEEELNQLKEQKKRTFGSE